MWVETARNLIVLDGVDYISPDGTNYPATFPREEIPGLRLVQDDQETANRKFNEGIEQQIRNLEAEVTPRRVREAIIGDGGWLENINNQILALRIQRIR